MRQVIIYRITNKAFHGKFFQDLIDECNSDALAFFSDISSHDYIIDFYGTLKTYSRCIVLKQITSRPAVLRFYGKKKNITLGKKTNTKYSRYSKIIRFLKNDKFSEALESYGISLNDLILYLNEKY